MAILIHPSIHAPLQLIDVSDPDTIREWVGGDIMRVVLENPDAILHTRMTVSQRHLPQNPRATAFAWLHSPGMYRERYVLSGPALIGGPMDGTGLSTSVPASLTNLLIPTGRLQMQFRDLQTQGPWLAVGHDDDWYAAYHWMLVYLGKANQSTMKLQVRAVPALDPSALEDVAGIGRQHLLNALEKPRVLGSASILSCTGVDDLAAQILVGKLYAGYGFHWRDLCLLNLADNGEHWLAIRHGFGFAVPPLLPLIENGGFAELVMRLLSVTRQQAAEGSY